MPTLSLGSARVWVRATATPPLLSALALTPSPLPMLWSQPRPRVYLSEPLMEALAPTAVEEHILWWTWMSTFSNLELDRAAIKCLV